MRQRKVERKVLMRMLTLIAASLLAAATGALLHATETPPPAPPPAPVPGVSAPTLLGPEDQVTIRVQDDDEISDKPIRIDAEGFLHLPLAGEVKAAGLSTRELEQAVTEKLKPYVKDPHVTVTLTESHSHPVSVLGAVNAPGVHQIEGPQHLLEVISAAGGLRPDAGSTLRITRQSQWGEIPLPNARLDLSGKYSVADIDLDNLLRGQNPEQNILVRPQDVISVGKADLVYVLGEVKKAGGFPILAHEKISILSALGLAEGMNANASPKAARILRAGADGPNRTDIPVNLSKIMQGEAPDVPLQPNDILLIPRDNAKLFAIKAAEAAVSIGTGLAIFGRR